MNDELTVVEQQLVEQASQPQPVKQTNVGKHAAGKKGVRTSKKAKAARSKRKVAAQSRKQNRGR